MGANMGEPLIHYEGEELGHDSPSLRPTVRTVYAAVIARSYPVSICAALSSDAFYWHTWGVAAQI
jgi:hypothetical protein